MRFIQSVKILTILFAFIAAGGKAHAQPEKQGEQERYFLEGVKWYNQKNLDSAKARFTRLIQLNPTYDAAYYYLANIALQSNDIVSGEMLLKKGIELDSSNYWYKNTLGQIYIQTGKADQALSIYEKLTAQHPKKTEFYYTLANLYLSKQNIEKSKEILDKIEKISGKSEEIAMARFNLYRMEQNWEGALKYLVEFDKEYQSARIEALIADMYADRFRDTLAIQYYNKALKQEPQYAPAIYGRAEVYRMKGDFPSFFRDILPFFANEQINPQMKVEYIRQLFQTPNFIQRFRPQVDSMVVNLEQAHPTDSTTLLLVAAYYAQGGDQQKCLELLKKNYNLYPNQFDAMFQYVTYIYHLKEWDNLRLEAEKALNNYPDNTDLIQLIGIAQFQLKQPQEAIKTYRQLEVISAAQKDTALLVTAYTLQGDLYAGMNNKKQAFSYYKKVLKLDPVNNPVLNNYAYYLSLEGKSLKQAYQMSRKTIESEPDNPTYLDTFGWILFLMDKPVEAKAQFKHAMLYGGKESAAILDHYAEVLYKLGETDLAFIYWQQAHAIDNTLGIEEKIAQRKEQLKR